MKMHLKATLWLPFLALVAARAPDRPAAPGFCPPKDITALLTSSSHKTCPVPSTSLDGESQGPWTYEPHCTTAGGQTYCIFTDSTFGPNGVSLIASPESASGLTPTLIQTYHSSFPSKSSARNLNLEPAFEVKDVPGKGKGLVATRHIKAKETFLIDHASLVVRSEFMQNAEKDSMWDMLDEAVGRLIDPSLVRRLDRTGRAPNVVEDVLRANTFNSDLDVGRSFVVFPLISRINHSCQPNSFIRYSSDGIIAGVSAFRDIKPGEEIDISYIALQEPSENRQALLDKNWGFKCTCSLCTSPSPVISANDERRSNLLILEAEAISSIHGMNHPKAIERLTRLNDAFAKEGLWPMQQDIYHVLATVSWVMGNKEDAVRYIEKKLDVKDNYGRLEVVDRSVEVEEEMKWVGRPR